MIVRFALGLMWLLHFLPLSVLARLGGGLGALLHLLGRERRRVTLTNLRLCFPQMSEAKAYEVTIPTQDRTEALQAFGEKRKPVFTGEKPR